MLAAREDEAQVRAAGGLVVRESGNGVEVAVVHRPRYDDLSLPKGKLAAGESFEQAALREVEEETGLRCELEGELEPALYRDRKGRVKLVRYFRMRPLGGTFEAGDEVDQLLWVASEASIAMLDYEHDRTLVRTLIEQPSR